MGIDLPLGTGEQFVEEQLRRERMDDLWSVLEPLLQQWGQLSEPDIRSRLTGYYVEDLNDSLADIAVFTEREHHLIITLDAFEKRPRSGEDWFLEKLLPKI